VINGKQDVLVGKIQERYGISKEEAQKQLDGWNYSDTTAASDPLRDRKVS